MAREAITLRRAKEPDVDAQNPRLYGARRALMPTDRALEGLSLHEVFVSLRCTPNCPWCAHCRGPTGPVFLPGDGGHTLDANEPFRVRLTGGDPFDGVDLAGWARWARELGAVHLTLAGPATSLTLDGVVSTLKSIETDCVRAVVPSLDPGELSLWAGRPLTAQDVFNGLDASLSAGLDTSVEIPVSAVNVLSLATTVRTLRERYGPSLQIFLRRVPVRQNHPLDPPPWSELPALGEALTALAKDSVLSPSTLPEEPSLPGNLHLDPASWGACVIPRSAWISGLFELSRVAHRDAPSPSPQCSVCSLKPRCEWSPSDSPPESLIKPLTHDDALALHGLSPHLSLEHQPHTSRTRRDRAALDLPDLLCFAPFTSLVMCDILNAPVPCAESWVRTEMTHTEQALSLGVTVDEIKSRHAESFARWGYPAFVPANEDWSIAEMWNGPLVMHMRRQMLKGGPSDRCRGNCRVMLGVEESFLDVLTRPESELTDTVIANRRHLVSEFKSGAVKLTAKPLELVLGVASHCNISCGFCSGPMGAYGELTERRLDEVIGYLPTLMNLSVIGPGEPLMSLRLPKLLEHINDHGYPSLQVAMTSNGTLMTRSWLNRHRNVRFNHIRISLNAGSAATHERMTGKRFFDRLLDNISALSERKAQSDSRFEFTLSCVLSDFVLGDLRNFAEIVDRSNANIVVEPMYGNSLGLSPYTRAEKLRALRDECDAVSEAFVVRNPKIARAFRAMERFASERIRTRNLTVLPHH